MSIMGIWSMSMLIVGLSACEWAVFNPVQGAVAFVGSAVQSDADETYLSDEPIRKAGFPWYDAQTGDVRSWPVPEMEPARSANRHGLPRHRSTPQNTITNINTPSGIMNLSLLTWGAIALFVIVLIALLIWGYTQLDAGPTDSRQEDDWDDLEQRIHELPFDVEAAASGDFRAQAWAAFEHEDYARAIMLLFSHVLLMLDRRGFIRLQKGKTNREYFREVRAHENLASFYQQVMIPFERSFYGHHPLDRETFLRCWNRLEAFDADVAAQPQPVSMSEESA